MLQDLFFLFSLPAFCCPSFSSDSTCCCYISGFRFVICLGIEGMTDVCNACLRSYVLLFFMLLLLFILFSLFCIINIAFWMLWLVEVIFSFFLPRILIPKIFNKVFHIFLPLKRIKLDLLYAPFWVFSLFLNIYIPFFAFKFVGHI